MSIHGSHRGVRKSDILLASLTWFKTTGNLGEKIDPTGKKNILTGHPTRNSKLETPSGSEDHWRYDLTLFFPPRVSSWSESTISFLPVILTFSSHENQIPVWNFLIMYLSSPDSQMYWTSLLSLMFELLNLIQNASFVVPGPVQKGFATFRVPSHQ